MAIGFLSLSSLAYSTPREFDGIPPASYTDRATLVDYIGLVSPEDGS
jgi:hypothetical protein